MSFEKPRPLSPNDFYEKALAEAESYSEMVDDERSGYLSWEERARRARRDQRARHTVIFWLTRKLNFEGK